MPPYHFTSIFPLPPSHFTEILPLLWGNFREYCTCYDTISLGSCLCYQAISQNVVLATLPFYWDLAFAVEKSHRTLHLSPSHFTGILTLLQGNFTECCTYHPPISLGSCLCYREISLDQGGYGSLQQNVAFATTPFH